MTSVGWFKLRDGELGIKDVTGRARPRPGLTAHCANRTMCKGVSIESLNLRLSRNLTNHTFFRTVLKGDTKFRSQLL